MEKQIQYETIKFTDWSRYDFLTNEQRNMLIQEKIERARIQSLVTKILQEKVGE